MRWLGNLFVEPQISLSELSREKALNGLSQSHTRVQHESVTWPFCGQMLNPKDTIKDPNSTPGGSPPLQFIIVGLVFFEDGDSFQKWLDAEPMVALGYPLAEVESQVGSEGLPGVAQTATERAVLGNPL